MTHYKREDCRQAESEYFMLASVLEFTWPITAPEHLSLTWTSITLSWPIVVCGIVVCWIVSWFKRKIQEARQKE